VPLGSATAELAAGPGVRKKTAHVIAGGTAGESFEHVTQI
jgi:hypothetical protein